MLKNNKKNILVKILCLVMLFTFAITITTSAENKDKELLAVCTKQIYGDLSRPVDLFTDDTDNEIYVEGLVFDRCQFIPSEPLYTYQTKPGKVYTIENALYNDRLGMVHYYLARDAKQYDIDPIEVEVFYDGTNEVFTLIASFYGREDNWIASMLSSGSVFSILAGAVVIAIAIVVTVKVSKKQGKGKNKKENEEKTKNEVKNKTKKTNKTTSKKASKTKKQSKRKK